VPTEHPWFGINCGFNSNASTWFVDGLCVLLPFHIFFFAFFALHSIATVGLRITNSM